MFKNARNNVIDIDDTTINYISFGSGDKNLIIIPGLGDGIKTVDGIAIPFSVAYKEFAKDYKVYVISRRNKLKKGFSISNMADDIAYIMNKLKIKSAAIAGVSQGGMIAQHIAIDYPKKVEKLVLIVTIPKINKIAKKNLKRWITYAYKKDYKNLLIDNLESIYTEKTLRKYRKFYNTIVKISDPKEYDRFIIEAHACLSHNAIHKIKKIECPTLIIGAKQDKVLGFEGSIKLHKKIKNSKLYLYEDYGHGVYEEAKDFNNRILEFLNEE